MCLFCCILTFIYADHYRTLLQNFRCLQVGVTCTAKRPHAARTMEDMVPSRIATAFPSGEQRGITPLGLQADQYRLARLSEIE